MDAHAERIKRQSRQLAKEQGTYVDIAHQEFEGAQRTASLTGHGDLETRQLLRSIAASLLVLVDR